MISYVNEFCSDQEIGYTDPIFGLMLTFVHGLDPGGPEPPWLDSLRPTLRKKKKYYYSIKYTLY